MVVVGADTITADHFVNNVGTFSLLLAAHRIGIPTYVVATSDKVLGSHLTGLHRPGGKESELPEEWRDLDVTLKLQRELFEAVPLDLLTGIITEDGVQNPERPVAQEEPRPGQEVTNLLSRRGLGRPWTGRYRYQAFSRPAPELWPWSYPCYC